MESTPNGGDKGKQPTKISASVRRKNAAENPPKKRSRKRAAGGEHEAAQVAREHDATEEGERGDDIMQELEEEEELREGDAATGNVQIRQPTWVDPYKVLAVPSEFPGGSSDTSILTGYAHYIARCV
jgi:hypothetical protein